MVATAFNPPHPGNPISSVATTGQPGFDRSSDGLILLHTNKVDKKLIKVMFSAAQSARRRGNAPSALFGFDEVFTNELVVRMVSSKVPKGLILSKIQMYRSVFDPGRAPQAWKIIHRFRQVNTRFDAGQKGGRHSVAPLFVTQPA